MSARSGFGCCFASSSMPRYAFIVKALSPRDGGWIRLGTYGAGGAGGPWYFETEEEGWQWIEFLWPLMVLSGDYVTVTVERTIRFWTNSHGHARSSLGPNQFWNNIFGSWSVLGQHKQFWNNVSWSWSILERHLSVLIRFGLSTDVFKLSKFNTFFQLMFFGKTLLNLTQSC